MTKHRTKSSGKAVTARTSARRRLAENLRELRKKAGYSQEALAEEAGFHRTFVSQIERAMNNVAIDNVDRLAAALGVDVSELIAKI